MSLDGCLAGHHYELVYNDGVSDIVSALEIGEVFLQELVRFAHLHEHGDLRNPEGCPSELFDSESHLGQWLKPFCGILKLGIVYVHYKGNEDRLTDFLACFILVHQLLIEYPFLGGVLIYKIEAVVVGSRDIGIEDTACDPEIVEIEGLEKR